MNNNFRVSESKGIFRIEIEVSKKRFPWSKPKNVYVDLTRCLLSYPNLFSSLQAAKSHIELLKKGTVYHY